MYMKRSMSFSKTAWWMGRIIGGLCVFYSPKIQSLLLPFPHSPQFSMHVSTSRAISRIQIHPQSVRVPDKSEKKSKVCNTSPMVSPKMDCNTQTNDIYTNGLIMMMCADEYTHVQSYLWNHYCYKARLLLLPWGWETSEEMWEFC